MATVTWSTELHTVVKKMKRLSLTNNVSDSTISNSELLSHNEQKAVENEFTQNPSVGKVYQQTITTNSYWQ